MNYMASVLQKLEELLEEVLLCKTLKINGEEMMEMLIIYAEYS